MMEERGAAAPFTDAISSVPVAGGVVAGFVTVAILDPGTWAALGTVGDRPGQVDLQKKMVINSQENYLSESDIQIALSCHNNIIMTLTTPAKLSQLIASR